MRVQILRTVKVLSSADPNAPKKINDATLQALAALVAVGPQGASKDRLSGLNWQDRPETWDAALRNRMSDVRKLVGADAIAGRGSTFRLDLPVEAVDAWLLGAIASGELPWSNELYAELLSPGPIAEGLKLYPDPLLEELKALEELQRNVLLDSVLSQPVLPPALRAECRRWASASPMDEELVVGVADALARSGDSHRAAQLLREVLDTFRADRLAPSGLLQDAIKRHGTELAAQERPHHLLVEKRPTLLSAQSDLAERIEKRLFEPEGPKLQLLVGVRGIGKTLLASEVAWRAKKAGWQVRCTAASDADSRRFEALLPLFSVLETEALSGSLSGYETDARSSWLAVKAELALLGEQPMLLVVDDAHVLDSASIDLLRYLARSSLPGTVRFLLTAPSHEAGDGPLRSLLRVASHAEHIVPPLDAKALRLIVDDRFPDRLTAQRHQLARSLAFATEGIPALVEAYLSNIETDTLRPDAPRWAIAGGLAEVDLRQMDNELRAIAVAASVLGRPATIGEISSVAELEPAVATERLLNLIRAGTMVELDGAPMFTVSSRMLSRAVVEATPRLERRWYHARAAEVETDVHRRAVHLLEAYPIKEDQLMDHLLAAVRSHSSGGTAGEAYDLLRRLRTVHDGPLPLAAEAELATALDLLSASEEAQRQRATVIGKALDEGEFDLASRAALGGLPASEVGGGDVIRVGHLRAVPAEELKPEKALEHLVQLVRQASLAGLSDVVEAAENQARRLDLSQAELARLSAAAPRRPSENPQARRRRWEAFELESLDTRTAQRLRHLEILDEFSEGRVVRSQEVGAQFEQVATSDRDPRELWYARLFETMRLQSVGAWSEADEMATAAYAEAAELGFRDALAVRTAQLFTPLWMADSLEDFATLLEGPSTGIDPSPLSEAGLLAVRQRLGVLEEADLRHFVERTRSRLDPLGFPALIVLCSVAPSSQELAFLDQLLVPHSGSFIVAGGGVCNLGPADRYRALLAEGEARSGFFDEAIRLSDTSGMLAWQVRCRLDAWRTRGSSASLDEARQLAAGTELESMLEGLS